MAEVVFKNQWFSPDGRRFRKTLPHSTTTVPDEFVKLLPKSAKVVEEKLRPEPVKVVPKSLREIMAEDLKAAVTPHQDSKKG